MRRFTRLTNAFSRKVDNLAAAVSLHFMYYNFAGPHKTLANPYPRTPAMAAGVADHVWNAEETWDCSNQPGSASGTADRPTFTAVSECASAPLSWSAR